MRSFLLLAVVMIVSSGEVFGQVGINTDSPAAGVSLHIKDNFESIRLDGTSPFLSFYNGTDYRGYLYMTGDNMYMYNRKAGNLFFGTSNSLKLAINSAGNVGIGTSLPELKLHVVQGAVASGDFNANSIAGFEKSIGNAYLSLLTNSDYENGLLFGNESSGQQGGIIYNNISSREGFQFRTNGNITRMTIDNVGDVGIGISNPGRPLDIKSRNGGDEYGIRLFRSGSSVDWEMSVFGGNFNFFYDGSVNPTARITTNGTYQSSDRRLKKNIRPYKNVLALVEQLNVDSYEYLADNIDHKRVVGLIAQEVEQVFPEIVLKAPNRNGELYYSIDYAKTGVLALKAIQELKRDLSESADLNVKLNNRVNSLEEQNADLQKRIQVLESKLNISL